MQNKTLFRFGLTDRKISKVKIRFFCFLREQWCCLYRSACWKIILVIIWRV